MSDNFPIHTKKSVTPPSIMTNHHSERTSDSERLDILPIMLKYNIFHQVNYNYNNITAHKSQAIMYSNINQV